MVKRFSLREHPAFFATAHKVRTKEWSVFFIASNETALAVRATKKAAALSVDRHKMVRRTREAWKMALQEHPTTQKKYNVVIFPNRITLSLDFSLMRQAALKTLERLYT